MCSSDLDTGQNRVEIGGAPAVIYRWHDDRIDVWVPFSAKSGPVVVTRGAPKPGADGSCCAEHGTVSTTPGDFTLVVPTIESFSPASAGLDESWLDKAATVLSVGELSPGLNWIASTLLATNLLDQVDDALSEIGRASCRERV